MDEALVGLVWQIVHPLLGARNAQGQVLQPWQRQIVDGEGGIERDLVFKARLHVLGDELDAGAAGIKCEEGVGLGGARLGQLGREIKLIGPARELAPDDLPLECGSHALEHVFAGGVIRPDQKRGLDPLLVHVEADRLRRLVIVPGGREHVWRAELACELRRAGVGDNRKRLGIYERLERGEQHVRPDVADDEVDLVRFDQLLRLLHADLGFELVVLVDDLDRAATQLAPEMIEPELERVAHVVADRGDRPAERADDADLERLLGERRRRAEGKQRDRSHQNSLHVHPPKGKLRRSYLIGECVKSPLGVAFRPAIGARGGAQRALLPCLAAGLAVKHSGRLL